MVATTETEVQALFGDMRADRAGSAGDEDVRHVQKSDAGRQSSIDVPRCRPQAMAQDLVCKGLGVWIRPRQNRRSAMGQRSTAGNLNSVRAETTTSSDGAGNVSPSGRFRNRKISCRPKRPGLSRHASSFSLPRNFEPITARSPGTGTQPSAMNASGMRPYSDTSLCMDATVYQRTCV